MGGGGGGEGGGGGRVYVCVSEREKEDGLSIPMLTIRFACTPTHT